MNAIAQHRAVGCTRIRGVIAEAQIKTDKVDGFENQVASSPSLTEAEWAATLKERNFDASRTLPLDDINVFAGLEVTT